MESQLAVTQSPYGTVGSIPTHSTSYGHGPREFGADASNVVRVGSTPTMVARIRYQDLPCLDAW